MTNDGVIDVLLADDQTLVRDGFRALIDREPDMRVVAEAADGVEAIAPAGTPRTSSSWTSACRTSTG